MSRCFFKLIIISLLLILGLESRLGAQLTESASNRVGRLEEYSSVQTNCIIQDSLGLIWLGTRKGLDRWDGIHISNYPGLHSGSAELNEIISISEDKKNNLWMIAQSGLSRNLLGFNMETQEFTNHDLSYENRSLIPVYIKYDALGFLWIACQREGIFQYFPDMEKLMPIPTGDSPAIGEPECHVVSIVSDTTGQRWIADKNNGLYRYDHRSRELIRNDFMLTPEEMFYSLDVDADSEGHLWILGTESDLYQFNPYTLQLDVVIEKNLSQVNLNSIGSLKVDHRGYIWYGNSLGLGMYDPRKDSITSFRTEGHYPRSVSDILVDRHNNILIATNEGLKFIDSKETWLTRIDQFRETIIAKAGWINDLIRLDDELWIGTSTTGLLRYNLKNSTFRQYHVQNELGSVPGHSILRLLVDKNERIWVMGGNGLHRYDPESDNFESFGFNFSPFITMDQEGQFWICGVSHVWKFDPVLLTSKLTGFNKTLPDFSVESGYTPFIRDKTGILWLGARGLVRIDPHTGSWRRYNCDRLKNNWFGDNNIRDIFCDSKDRLWISTPVGVYRVLTYPETDSISFRLIRPNDGSTLCATRIVEDGEGNICIGTCTGMYVIRQGGHMEYFSSLDGLPENPRSIRWLGTDQEGSVYAGTVDLTIFSEGFLMPNTDAPEVVLTSLRIAGEQLSPGPDSPLEKNITLAEKVELKHKQNFIRIDFASLNFNHPAKNRYKYFLKGVDEDTVWAGGKYFAEYTDLSPGKYRFWVTGSNNSGIWNQEGKTLLIHIHPPWFRTTAALIAWDVLLILAVFGFIRWRTRKLSRDKLRLEVEVENRVNEIRWMNMQIKEMEEMKTRFFNNISHEFRTLISLIMNPLNEIWKDAKISKKSRSKLELARRNSNKLKSLVDQLLDLSKIDRGNLKLVLTDTSIFDFAHAISVSFLSLAETKGIRYSYHIPTDDATYLIDVDKLEKILNNLLSNAFKFTDEGGEVTLKLEKLSEYNGFEEMLKVSVSDTGTGIPPEEQDKVFDRFYQAESTLLKEGDGAGIGLALTHDLIKLMQGSIKLESEPGKGSTFKVLIPLGKNHLKEKEYSIAEDGETSEIPSQESSIFSESSYQKMHDPALYEDVSGQRPIILVVEDNAEVRTMISENLQAEFRVLEAINGSAGLKIAFEHLPDLILTDLIMPVMDGTEMCSLLKSDIRTSHIPVIMLTGKVTTEERIQGLETGADDYITKPFEMPEVAARVKNLVSQRKKLRRKYSHMISFDFNDEDVSSLDQKFLNSVVDVIDREMCNDKFEVSCLCRELNISHSTLFRKIHALTGLSPIEFIRNRRLQRAAYLLKQQYGNVSQVAMEVGFSNPSYFTKMFKKAYSISPSEFTKT